MNPLAFPCLNRFDRHALRLLATGVFVALAGAVTLTAEAAPMDGHRHAGPMDGPMGGLPGGLMVGPRAERMLEAVGASAEQRAQIRQIMDAARADLQAQRESGRALRDQMRQLFTQPTVDANAAEALRQQQMARQDAVSRRMMQAMLEASRVLSPEQRAKLADMAAQHRAMMERRAAPK
jgi:Spy/CpxP family protein refolding chaperone